MSASNEGRYRSPSRLALWASTLLVAYAVTAAVSAFLNAYQLGLLGVFRAGGTIPYALAEAQDARQRVVTGFEFGVELAALIVCLTWLYRVSRNTWLLRTEGLEHTPGWSVGCFFVPVVGLVVPYNVFHELWRGNSPVAAGQWRQAAVSPLLAVWWAVCVVSALAHYSPLEVVLGRVRLTELLDWKSHTFWLGHLWEFFWGRLLVNVVRDCPERADRGCRSVPYRLAETPTRRGRTRTGRLTGCRDQRLTESLTACRQRHDRSGPDQRHAPQGLSSRRPSPRRQGNPVAFSRSYAAPRISLPSGVTVTTTSRPTRKS